jgi:peptide/nickel transport system substrate-binding protein
MNRLRRFVSTPRIAVVAIAIVIAAAAGIRRPLPNPTASDARADTLVAAIRAEPRSFNRYTSRDLTTTILTMLMHGGLVHVDRSTNRLEPELADRWDLLPDQRTYRLHLRPDLRFSDGSLFTADDVVFSFAAIYDEKVGSVLADSLQVRGQPLIVAAVDPSTVTIRFPTPFGPGLRILDGVPIYPRHLLARALAAGEFRSTWRAAAAPSEIAGLGPFVLRRYEPGQRLTFEANPYYWARASGRPGVARVVLQIVPDQDAELLQIESANVDLVESHLRPSDVPALKRAASAHRVVVSDAGVGVDGDLFWINLTAAKARDPRSAWLQHPSLRRAISRAIDRVAFVDSVYYGAAEPADSVVSPGNRDWHVVAPPPAYDAAAARNDLAEAGLSSGSDGALRDQGGRPARFTLLTQKGNTSLERGAYVIRDSLAAVGVHVDVVALEVGALVDHLMRGDYDSTYFRLVTTDSDPALNLDFWLSSGSAHVWNPEQRAAATPWEREIDALMDRVATTFDGDQRHGAFADVQRIMARELPVVCFAFPRLSVAVSARLAGVTPTAYNPPVLWNPAAIQIRR